MQHLSFASRTMAFVHRAALLALGFGPLPGCLAPLPLQQQNSVDGGQLLMVPGAMPAFGTQRALMTLMTYTYQIDVVSDSPSLAARLYLQINGSCCNLNLDTIEGSPVTTRFDQQAQVTPLAQGNNLYTVEFNKPVVPCQGTSPGAIIYVVPVLASGGFMPNPIQPDGLGVVDRSHYWTVLCGP